MPRTLILEDFDIPPSHRNAPPAHSAPDVSSSDLEAERLQAYENGYGAGWDDASKALAEEQERISSEFARHLQELSFTYHEAHSALQQELSDLVRGLMSKVLIPASQATLGEMIHARIAEIAQEQTVPVEILVSEDNVERLQRLVGQAHGPPLRIVPEASLGAGQAFLRFGTSEEQIDLDRVMSDLATAVERYFSSQDGPMAGDTSSPPTEDRKHG